MPRFEAASTHSNDTEVLPARAISFVIRDMGNGVDRIEMPDLIDAAAAKVEANLPGRVKLSFPLPVRIADCLGVATRLLLGRAPYPIKGGCAEVVGDNAIRVIAWRMATHATGGCLL